MIIDKTFEVVINLTKINEIFSDDLNALLLKKIISAYENKCFKACYILKITDIIERGLLNVNKRSLTCEISVEIKFAAKVIIYEYLEILNNNIIENITKTRIECRSGNVASYINIQNKDMQSFKVGQIIPILVGKATYQTMQSTVSINAFPFIPVVNDNTYYNIKPLTDDEKEIINSTIMIDIHEIQEQLKTISKDRLKFFKSLLYPYKTVDSQKNNVKDIIELNADGIVCLFNKLDLFNHQIINLTEYENPIPESGLVVYKVYLNTYLRYIKTILELCITYKDDDIFESHQNVFDVYAKYKLNK